jgi:hypothetical protein
MKRICYAICLLLFVSTRAEPQQVARPIGFLTDTLSGRVGATGQHGELSKRNVASGKAKYAIYDEKSKQLYILACTAPSGQSPASSGTEQAVSSQLSAVNEPSEATSHESPSASDPPAAGVSSEEWKNLDQRCVEQYLGKRVRITGTVSASPITRAGQSYAPDAIAAPKDASGNADQTSAARTVSGDTNASAGQGSARVQHHASVASGAGRGAQDTSTPVAGILTISSVEVLSSPQRTP